MSGMSRTAATITTETEQGPSGARRRPRAGGAERRELMLRAAARLFGEQGYHATTMRQIADATGLLPGSLYAHITGKEELLYEIVRDAGQAFLRALDDASAGPASPEERFRRALRAHVQVITDHQDSARVFHHEWRALTGPHRAEIVRLRDRYERRWDELLGDLPGIADPKIGRLLVLSAANWIYTWYEPGGGLPPARIADRFAGLLLDGLLEGRAPMGLGR
jgi:TetR/AcrR family transcriptional regulator, cholesterol catabolism regulator